MFSPEQMNMGISKSRLMVLISFFAVLFISERFSWGGGGGGVQGIHMQERFSWGGGYKTLRGLAGGGGGGVQGIHMQERFSWGGGGGGTRHSYASLR